MSIPLAGLETVAAEQAAHPAERALRYLAALADHLPGLRADSAQLHTASPTGARSFSGSHQSRLAAYHSTVARNPSSNETSGSQPSSLRSFEESSR